MKGLVKIKLVLDKALIGTNTLIWMNRALESLSGAVNEQSQGQLGIQFDIYNTEFSEENIDWVKGTYRGREHWYPSAGWAQEMNDLFDEENTSVMLVIAPENWKNNASVIGGINYFQTQIIHPQLYWKLSAWRETIEHEFMHSLDNRATQFPNIDLILDIGTNNHGKEVDNWDQDVVHESDENGVHLNDFDYVWQRCVEAIAEMYPYSMRINRDKLVQITNELLFRDPTPTEEDIYVGKEEDFVRADVGSLDERWKYVALINSARNIPNL